LNDRHREQGAGRLAEAHAQIEQRLEPERLEAMVAAGSVERWPAMTYPAASGQTARATRAAATVVKRVSSDVRLAPLLVTPTALLRPDRRGGRQRR
jgi:hypothetical protein